MQPKHGGEGKPRILIEHPQSQTNCQQNKRGHEAVEFPLHYFETLKSSLVLGQSVINEQARKIKQASKPANHKKNMKCFEP